MLIAVKKFQTRITIIWVIVESIFAVMTNVIRNTAINVKTYEMKQCGMPKKMITADICDTTSAKSSRPHP